MADPSPESEAPEVAPSSRSQLAGQDAEGLQPASPRNWQHEQQSHGQVQQSSLYSRSTEPKPPTSSGFASSAAYSTPPALPPPQPYYLSPEKPDSSGPQVPSPRSSRKALLIPAILVGIAALLIGLGAGIGIGFAVGDKQKSSPTPSPTSTTSPFATSGYSGTAAFNCNNTGTYVSDTFNSMTFQQECNVAYLANSPTWNATESDPELDQKVSVATVYTFQACMDACALYNIWNTTSPLACQAVTFDANLTYNIAKFGGNCFMRNLRGTPYTGDPKVNYSTTASAYWFPEDT